MHEKTRTLRKLQANRLRGPCIDVECGILPGQPWAQHWPHQLCIAVQKAMLVQVQLPFMVGLLAGHAPVKQMTVPVPPVPARSGCRARLQLNGGGPIPWL
jgi:hypothetical protein